MPTALRVSCFVYRILLICYPGELRRRFGEEMAEVFADQMRGEWRRHGLAGSLRAGLNACWEIVSVAVPLQLENSVVIAATLSFVSSSVLFLALFRAVPR